MRAADDAIDTTKDENQRLELINNSLSFLAGNNYRLDNYDLKSHLFCLRSILDTFDKCQKDNYLTALKRVCLITEKIKSESDPKALLTLTRLEGQVTSRLFTSLLPTEYTKSSRYHSFMKAMTRMGRSGNTFDTFLDIGQDFKNGEIAISGTLANRLLLLFGVIPDSTQAIKNLKVRTSAMIAKKFLSKLI